MKIYQKIYEYLSAGKAAALVTLLDRNSRQSGSGKVLIGNNSDILSGKIDRSILSQVQNLASDHIARGQSAIAEVLAAHGKTEHLFINVYMPSPRLIILGGGHVGAALCRIAGQLDYEIVLVDDRPAFADQTIHPQAHRLICEKFDRALDQLEPSPSDFIVIVTRGHQHDRLCLEKALNRKAAYIGMIGSRRRVSKQLREFAESGYPDEQLSRVHAPIGLPIGAVTEAEIAISILAEITRVRRNNSSDEAVQVEVLHDLCRLEQNGEKAVLATIIATQGSTPRKTGSQMIVYPDGALKGTVGGGCSEAEVRREALLCLDREQTGRVRLKLTADAAAGEGMACGGIMDIYLELLPHISPEIF